MEKIRELADRPFLFRETIEIDAPREKVLDVIKDPMRLPEWSLYVRNVEAHGASYTAKTQEGNIEFTWAYDAGAGISTMSYEHDGMPAQNHFFAYEENGRTVFGEQFHIDAAVSDGLLEGIRTTGLAEIAKLKRLLEA